MSNKTKKQVISELKAKCAKMIGNKRTFKFVSQGYALLLKPVQNIVVDGHLINLRCSSRYDSPFLDEQDDKDKTRLFPVEFDDNSLIVSPVEMSKLMYLMLHPWNESNGGSVNSGVSFRLEDKEAEAKAEFEFFELEDQARELIKTKPSDEVKAAHFVVLGHGSHDMDVKEARVNLIKHSTEDPEGVIEAFGDERTKYKFKFQTAVMMGYIYTNDDQTEARMANTQKIFLSIPKGADMIEEFATFYKTENRQVFIERIKKILTK